MLERCIIPRGPSSKDTMDQLIALVVTGSFPRAYGTWHRQLMRLNRLNRHPSTRMLPVVSQDQARQGSGSDKYRCERQTCTTTANRPTVIPALYMHLVATSHDTGSAS